MFTKNRSTDSDTVESIFTAIILRASAERKKDTAKGKRTPMRPFNEIILFHCLQCICCATR